MAPGWVRGHCHLEVRPEGALGGIVIGAGMLKSLGNWNFPSNVPFLMVVVVQSLSCV